MKIRKELSNLVGCISGYTDCMIRAEDELVEQVQKNKTLKDLLKQEGKTRNDLKIQIASLQEKNLQLQNDNQEASSLRQEKEKLETVRGFSGIFKRRICN